jgi:hypothetical protein
LRALSSRRIDVTSRIPDAVADAPGTNSCAMMIRAGTGTKRGCLAGAIAPKCPSDPITERPRSNEEAVEQWHRQDDGVSDLQVVTDIDLPPPRTLSSGRVRLFHRVTLSGRGTCICTDVICCAPFGHQLLPAEVERAYRRQLEMGDQQPWPPPTGYWRSDDRFVLTDGRNRFVACLMLGVEYLLVAWLVPAS